VVNGSVVERGRGQRVVAETGVMAERVQDALMLGRPRDAPVIHL